MCDVVGLVILKSVFFDMVVCLRCDGGRVEGCGFVGGCFLVLCWFDWVVVWLMGG